MARLVVIVSLLALLLIGVTNQSITAGVAATVLLGTLIFLVVLKRYLPEQHALSTLLFPGSGATFAQSAPKGTSGEVLISYHAWGTLHKRLKTSVVIIALTTGSILIGLRVIPVVSAALLAPIIAVALGVCVWAVYSLLTLAPRGERVSALKALIRTDPRIAFARYAPTEQTGALKVGYSTYKRLYRVTSVALIALVLLVAIGLGREIYLARWSADQNFRAASQQFGVVLDSLTRGQGNLKEELAKLAAQSLQTAPGIDQNSLTQNIIDQVTQNLPDAPTEIVKETETQTITERTIVETETAQSIQLEGSGQYVVKDNRGVTIFAFGPNNEVTLEDPGIFNLEGNWYIDGSQVTATATNLNLTANLKNTDAGSEGTRSINTRADNFTNFSPSRNDLEASLAAIDTSLGTTSAAAAPKEATFLVLSANATLTGERVLIGGTGLTLTDAGANGNATLDLDSFTLGTTDTNATAGSVFFAGTAGVLQQDNANFFWDDTNNRLGIGTASPLKKLHVVDASTSAVRVGYDATNFTDFRTDLNGFGEIDPSGGRLGINVDLTTTNASAILHVNIPTGSTVTPLKLTTSGVAHGLTSLVSTDTFFSIKHHETKGSARLMGLTDVDTTESPLALQGIFGVTDPSDNIPAVMIVGSKKSGAGEGVLGALETVLQVETGVYGGGTKLLTILGSGNVGIGTTAPNGLLAVTGNVLVGNTAAGTGCAVCLVIAGSTAPTASITDGIQLFAVDVGGLGHELRVRDEAGNVTTLSPHTFSLFQPDQDYYLPWSYTSEKGTEAINVDMYGAIQQIELISGKHFIYGKNLATGDTFTPTTLTGILSVPEAFAETNVRLAAIEEQAKGLVASSSELGNRVTALETTPAPEQGLPAELAGGENDDSSSPQLPATSYQLLNSTTALDINSLILRGDATIYGTLLTDTLEVATALNLHGDATIWGSLLVKGDVELEANARVAGTLTRGNERSGHVTIPAGAAWAKVEFTKPFTSEPNVIATLLNTSVEYVITDVSVNGFTITLAENPGTAATISWIALENVPEDSTAEVGGEFSENVDGLSSPPPPAGGEGETEGVNPPAPAADVPAAPAPETAPETPTDTIPLVSSSQ